MTRRTPLGTGLVRYGTIRVLEAGRGVGVLDNMDVLDMGARAGCGS